MATQTKRSARHTRSQSAALTAAAEASSPEERTSGGSDAVRVVGIGASAGGLDAFIELVSAIPVETGLAFVLIQHLDPRHDSMLVDILAGDAASEQRHWQLLLTDLVDGIMARAIEAGRLDYS